MCVVGVLTLFIAVYCTRDLFPGHFNIPRFCTRYRLFFSGCVGVDILYYFTRYRWWVSWVCWHTSLLHTLFVMCFLDVLVLTYLTAVYVTGDVFTGRVDIPHCCKRYSWCVFWMCWCWHTLLLYTLHVMCFLGVLTHLIAVYVTGDVFSGRADTPHCCTRYSWCVFWLCWCWHTSLL